SRSGRTAIPHVYEPKAARVARLTVGNHIDRIHHTIRLKELSEILSGRGAHKVADENIHRKILSLVGDNRGQYRPVWRNGLCRRMGIDFLRGRGLKGARWMTALTQYLSDLPGREDGEKAGDARTDCEPCQLAFV